MLRKQPHDERGDASATPERFFLYSGAPIVNIL